MPGPSSILVAHSLVLHPLSADKHVCGAQARYLFFVMSTEYPQVPQGWLEGSRLEEEAGQFDKSLSLLRKGCRASPCYNEGLLLKAVKQHERMGHLGGARALLGGALQLEAVERSWRAVLEGALMEERAGRVQVARKLLSVLVLRVSWYGPIYYEAFRLEEKAEQFAEAERVIRRGLAELPRYGPLWFGLLRLVERADVVAELRTWQRGDGAAPLLLSVRRECHSAIGSISRELIWKVHFEQAQIEERAAVVVARSHSVATGTPVEMCLDALLDPARRCFVLSMLSCPSNLRWKIFLAGARMELAAGRVSAVKSLLRQAHQEVPSKSRLHVFLECSRLEEYAGSVDEARKVLAVARASVKSEWKVYLESVLVEARAGLVRTAIFIADQALRVDAGSGRLWALLLQLVHRDEWRRVISSKLKAATTESSSSSARAAPNIYIQVPADYVVPSKFSVLSRALQVVPKSGEVWCEGARLLLNPLSARCFDPARALQFLSFAVMFTPQYGDSFVECVRLEMLLQVVLPRVLTLLGIPVPAFLLLLGSRDPESDFEEAAVAGEDGSGLVSAELRRELFPRDKNERRAAMQQAADGLLCLHTSAASYQGVDLRRLNRR